MSQATPPSQSQFLRAPFPVKPPQFQLPLHHHHSPFLKLAVMQQHHGPLHRRDTDPAATDSTMRSTITVGAGMSSSHSSLSQQRKRFGRHNIKLPSFLKLAPRKRPLSETQLRKKVKKAADKGDWDGVRKLVSRFSDIAPKAVPESGGTAKRGSFNPSANGHLEESGGSYGSRQRRSFKGSESSAAASVIKAAALGELEESSDESGQAWSQQRPNVGENILHDLLSRCHPLPLDVLETLLAALRHRRGYTYGTNDHGRTPLHLAAMSGAPPELIDALIRADPSPASMGDCNSRSPLHLAMKFLVSPALHIPHCHGKSCKNGKKSNKKKHIPQERIPSPREIFENTLRTVQILKDVMLTHPGGVDFKDEDAAGFSPLDYAIDGNIKNEELIQTLLRRKEPRLRRSTHRAHGLPNQTLSKRRISSTSICSSQSIFSAASRSTFSGDQDISILRQLEAEEVEARRQRIEKMKTRRQKTQIHDALFDVFGIEEQPQHAAAFDDTVAEEPIESVTFKSVDEEEPSALTQDELYNQHLEDYLDCCMGEFEGEGDYHHCDDDNFDIFEDPEEHLIETPQEETPQDENMEFALSFSDIVFCKDDECVSLASDVTFTLQAKIVKTKFY